MNFRKHNVKIAYVFLNIYKGQFLTCVFESTSGDKGLLY